METSLTITTPRPLAMRRRLIHHIFASTSLQDADSSHESRRRLVTLKYDSWRRLSSPEPTTPTLKKLYLLLILILTFSCLSLFWNGKLLQCVDFNDLFRFASCHRVTRVRFFWSIRTIKHERVDSATAAAGDQRDRHLPVRQRDLLRYFVIMLCCLRTTKAVE